MQTKEQQKKCQLWSVYKGREWVSESDVIQGEGSGKLTKGREETPEF